MRNTGSNSQSLRRRSAHWKSSRENPILSWLPRSLGGVESKMLYSSVTSFLRRLHDNRFTRPTKRLIMRWIAARNGPRTILNRYYNLLGAEARSSFYTRYAKMFRGQNIFMSPGEWNIYFVDRWIRLPLRSSWAWLDWDLAVSIVAHDIEVKQTYAAIILSDQRPAFFLDIGANYGTHSVIFLSAGIPVIAFEPNPSCSPHFQVICKLNGLSGGRWEQVAIGSEISEIELVYPEKDTWHGSVSSNVVASLRRSGDMTSLRVPVKNLDYYLNDIPRGKVLIKIDVEGYEIEILKGASRVLRDCVPTIIFESNDAKARGELFCLLVEFGYCIHQLPWRPFGYSRVLGVEEFLASVATNFIAIPRLRLRP
jgi:FkbM family methyltransferase